MAAQVSFHLTFGFGDKSKAGAIPHQGRERANAERAGVPQWLEHAGSTAEFAQAGFTPGEVIGLFACRIDHELTDFRVPGEQRLGVIQRLSGHLARMINPHQGGRLAFFVGSQGGVGLLGLSRRRARGGRYRPAGGRGRQQGAQGAIGCRDDGVQRGAAGHGAAV